MEGVVERERKKETHSPHNIAPTLAYFNFII
jgi:hypothetical protein